MTLIDQLEEQYPEGRSVSMGLTLHDFIYEQGRLFGQQEVLRAAMSILFPAPPEDDVPTSSDRIPADQYARSGTSPA